MDSNGRTSPNVKSSTRSRSRSPQNSGGGERRSSRGRPRNRSRERSNRRNNADIACRRVYIANIPFDSKWTDIKDLFREKVGDVTYVQLFEDESGKFRGCGVVELKEMSSVQKAVDVLHRFDYRGRKLVVKEDYDLERDKIGRLIPNSGSGSRDNRNRDRSDNFRGNNNSSDMVNFNTYGLSPQFLESLGITGPLSSKVFIANLDFKVTSKKLGEVFKLAGKIMNIDLKTDAEGNSKGHGVVEFDHPVEAVQAISMFNGQKLFQRIMSVRMDRFDVDDNDPRPSKLPNGLAGVGKGLGAGGQAIHLSGMGGNMQLGAANVPATALGMMGNTGFGINPMAAAAAAMTAGLGTTGLGATGLSAMGLGTGLGASGLAGAAGLGTTNLGLGLGNANLSSAAERGLLGNNLGGSLGGGLGLGGNSSLGLGSSGTSGMGFGLAGTGGGSAGNAGLMGNMGSGSGLAGLSSNSALAAAAGMGNTGNTMGSSSYADFAEAAYERATGGVSGGGDGGFGNRTSDTVQVRNLPNNYSWQNLRDRFRDVGDVRYTELKGRGTAVIRFNSERDAQRAVDLMNGIRIDGRPIEVRLY